MTLPGVQDDVAGAAPRQRKTVFFFVFGLFLLFSNIQLKPSAAVSAHDIRIGYLFAVVLILGSLPQTRGAWRRFFCSKEAASLAWTLVPMLLLSSLSGIYVLGSGFFNTFMLLSLVICAVYGYLFAFMAYQFRLETVLTPYLFVCKLAVILGTVQQIAWLLFHFDLNAVISSWGINRANMDVDGFLIRANSFWQEPAHYGQFLSVATVLGVFVILGPGSKGQGLGRLLSKGWAWAIVISMLSTFSLSALFPIPLALSCCALMKGYRKYSIVLLGLLILTCIASSQIQERLVGLIFEFGDARYLNLSIWTFYSNFQTSVVSLLRAPFGLGPGNHYWAYQYWINTFQDLSSLPDQAFLFQNARDGSSLIFRFVTEFGLMGIAFIGFWLLRLGRLLRTKLYLSSPHVLVEMAGILGFMAFSLRQGAYSIFEPWLFLLIAFMARTARFKALSEDT